MNINFGNGSSAQTERSSWEIYYPWLPFHQTYDNEPGVFFHLSPQDTNDIVRVISGAMAGVGAAIANVFGAFAGVLPIIIAHLVKNNDGSITIHIAPHGFQVGNLPAADPNVWVNGAWVPVTVALQQLGGVRLATRSAAQAESVTLPPPHTSSRGRLVSAIAIAD
jgi:hypothetical protein